MRTLINDPFADDAVSILAWAFGAEAANVFHAYHVVQGQRAGQAFMNTLYEFDNESYRRLTGSLVDPFYKDSKIPDAIDKMTSK